MHQDNLKGFLTVELDLAKTFLGMAATASTQDDRTRLLNLVAEAIKTVRHFEGRIEDPAASQAINARAAELYDTVHKLETR